MCIAGKPGLWMETVGLWCWGCCRSREAIRRVRSVMADEPCWMPSARWGKRGAINKRSGMCSLWLPRFWGDWSGQSKRNEHVFRRWRVRPSGKQAVGAREADRLPQPLPTPLFSVLSNIRRAFVIHTVAPYVLCYLFATTRYLALAAGVSSGLAARNAPFAPGARARGGSFTG